MNNKTKLRTGFIIFSGDLKWTILVETYNGNLGFPKGKLKKGEKLYKAALRELEEETGLTADDIVLLNKRTVNEIDKSGLRGKYFVAYCEMYDNETLYFNSNELASVDWYNCDNIHSLKSIKRRRKDVFTKAYDMAIHVLEK